MDETAKVGKIPEIGDAAPAFSLSDSNRQTVSLSGILQNETALLVFFRGYW